MNKRYNILAKRIVNHSLKIKRGQTVLIIATSTSRPLLTECIKAISMLRAYPLIEIIDQDINKYTIEQKVNLFIKKLASSDASIRILDGDYTQEISNATHQRMQIINRLIQERYLNWTKTHSWVLCNYPNTTYANNANMSLKVYSDYVLKCCTLNYKKISQVLEPLKKLMEKTNMVKIVSNDTDLTFSIKNMDVVKCTGEHNLPDGEIFVAPVKNSANGKIYFNTPTEFKGVKFKNVRLFFKNGKITNAFSDINQEYLEKIFDIDDGARYLGEFAIAFNPLIKYPVGDILLMD